MIYDLSKIRGHTDLTAQRDRKRFVRDAPRLASAFPFIFIRIGPDTAERAGGQVCVIENKFLSGGHDFLSRTILDTRRPGRLGGGQIFVPPRGNVG